MGTKGSRSRPTSLFLQQIFLLVVVPQLWWFDLRGQFWVDVMTVTDVVHPAAAARDDSLNLLRLIHLSRLIPVCEGLKKYCWSEQW